MSGISMQLIASLLILGLSTSAQAKLSVFACEPEWAALTQELGGKHTSIFTATHAGQDPHHIQARPSLIARLRSADLAVCSGADLETGWMPMLQRRARNASVLPGKPGYFEAADQVVLLDKPEKLDRAGGDVHEAGNPHVQLDPRRILEIAKALSARLQQLDPGNKLDYESQLSNFTQRWESSMKQWQSEAVNFRSKRVIVHHREWIYLLDWLGMQRVGSLEPKPGIPPNMAHLAALKNQPADLIFISPLNDAKPANWLKDKTDRPVVVLPQTVGAVPDSDNLFSFFDEIIRRLSKL